MNGIKWFRAEQACGSIRHHLYLCGNLTPYFIEEARHRAHYSYGSKVGLWGSGMGPVVDRKHPDNRIAGFLGGFDRVSDAKQKAEQLALMIKGKAE